MAAYVTVEQLRDEGVSQDLSDAQLTRVVQRASALIDAWCHRWFYPRPMTLLLDGSGSDTLQIGPPIVAVTRVRVLAPDTVIIPETQEIVDPTSLRVFNRHMTGLTDPDDRNNPKLQFLNSWTGNRRMVELFPSGWFPVGVQNIEIIGWFGYTDYDPDEVPIVGWPLLGKTPANIATACTMLAVRDLLPLADIEGRNEASLASRVASLRTRDQSITYNAAANSSTGITTGASYGSGIMGNTEIQSLLSPFVRGGKLGAV